MNKRNNGCPQDSTPQDDYPDMTMPHRVMAMSLYYTCKDKTRHHVIILIDNGI